jgi:high-affinity Fe2+/Pb2+ permease
MYKFMYGAFGSVVPDILLFYSKTKTAEAISFNVNQYIVAVVLYAVAAGIVARIYPYRMSRDIRWNALVVGITLPVIVATLLSVADRGYINPHQGLQTRGVIESNNTGERVDGTLLDLMSIF